MKSKRAIFMLLLSLMTGIAAVLLAARWLGQQAAGSSTRVVVATSDLQLGQPIQAAMLQEIAWPAGTAPVGAFESIKQLEGRIVRTTVFKGEPVLEPKLAPEGTKGGLGSVIKDGSRAITVKVNEVVGVAGFLVPGSYVDLLVNVRDDRGSRDERDGTISKIVLERILVLAIAQEASRDETKPKVVNAVTLEVTPEQAEKIDLARNIGTLSLVLRNEVDIKDATTDGIRRTDLLGNDSKAVVQTAAKPAPAPARPSPVRRAAPRPAVAQDSGHTDRVEVIRGVHKATSDF